MFSGDDIIFDLSCEVITDMIEGLYYPQSPYLFNIIEPNLLGKIYEVFLTEQLVLLDNNTIGLGKKKDCQNRSVVTTPTEIVKYMVEKTLANVCVGKTPTEILNIKVAISPVDPEFSWKRFLTICKIIVYSGILTLDRLSIL